MIECKFCQYFDIYYPILDDKSQQSLKKELHTHTCIQSYGLIENKIKKIEVLAYKNRFSIYYNPKQKEVLIRVYFFDGKQHKEIGESLHKALDKMIYFLTNDNT